MSLEDIREKKQSKWVYVVIGMLLVGMAGFGTSQFGTGGGKPHQALLSAGDAEVSIREYENTLRYIQQNNPNIPIEMVKQAAVSSLKQRVAMLDYLNRHSLTASHTQVDEVIRSNPSFFDNGKFSEAAFHRVVTVAPELYRKSIATEIALQNFQSIIANTAIVSDADVKPYINNFSRDIRIVSLTRKGFSYSPTDNDMKAYYEQHKKDYMTAEKIAIKYVDFNPVEIAQRESVSEAEILAQASATREVNYWIFTDENKAKEAFAAYQSGQAVDEVKKAFSEAIQDSGELGKVSAKVAKDSLISQAESDAIFALKKVGELTAPIRTENGVMVFELTNKGDAIPSDSTKAAVKNQLQEEKAKPKITELSEKLNKVVFEQAAPSLEDIAEAVGMTVTETKEQNMTELSGILALPELSKAIAESDKVVGKLQEPVIIGNRVIIYHFSSVKPAQQKALTEVKDLVEKAVINEKVNLQMKKVATQLINDSKKEGLAKAAKKAGYTSEDYKDFSASVAKGSVLDPMAALLIAEQFPRLGKENAREIISPAGGHYIYTTTAVRLGEPLADKEQQQLKQTLASQLGGMELNNFMSAVMAKTKITDRSATLLNQ